MPGSCYYHSGLPAASICSRCGRSICNSCYKPYAGLALCPDCYHTRVPQPMPTSVLGRTGVGSCVPPPGGVLYGPFQHLPFLVRFWWVPIALFGIAAALILLNGIALLSPAFFGIWIGLFPWVLVLGSFGFILGVVLGLVLIGVLVMMFLGLRVLAALIAIPTAIVSLFIGGGFIFGGVIGVLAALLVIISERSHM